VYKAGQSGLITKHIEKHIFCHRCTDFHSKTLITREKSVEICASVAISCQLLKTRLLWYTKKWNSLFGYQSLKATAVLFQLG